MRYTPIPYFKSRHLVSLDNLALLISAVCQGLNVTKRSDMPNLPNERAFMLKNFMSAEECATSAFSLGSRSNAAVIAATEQIKYQSIDWEYTPDYRYASFSLSLHLLIVDANRHADRLVARSADLAEAMWQRLLPFLTRDDLFELRPFGFGARGTWQPISVNDVIRFTRHASRPTWRSVLIARNSQVQQGRTL